VDLCGSDSVLVVDKIRRRSEEEVINLQTVFVVNKGGHDYMDATRFGRVAYLSEGSINKYSISKMYRTFAGRLKQSQAEDYIVISGLTVMACIACACFGHLHKRLNLLLFKSGRYVERRLILGSLLDYTPEAQVKQIAQITEEKEG